MGPVVSKLGTRASKARRISNAVMLVLVGAVFWLAVSSSSQNERITTLERSDCKESRVSGGEKARAACDRTLDHVDRTRPIKSLCIAPRRVGYHCPLSESQARKLREAIGVRE